jgi:hypothetical protein
VALHTRIQLALARALPTAQLERRFPSIGRIADVTWPAQRLIFEIQCSPIDPIEVVSRCHDYLSLNWQPIWILSDALYNQPRLSQVEWALQPHPHYYCSALDGTIYDQFQTVHRGQRHRGPPLPISPCIPVWSPAPASPLHALQRRSAWPLYFEGDLTHRIAVATLPLADLLQQEQPPRPSIIHRIRDGYLRQLHRALAHAAGPE